MLVPLDSPRWNTFEHAYGAAGDTPHLILAIAAEKQPNYSTSGSWFEVYSSLYHQHTTYSATYAALPHIVRIAEVGTLEQRVAVLCLAGEMRIHGYADGEIPNDLFADFEAAMAAVKNFSLKTLREAKQKGILGTVGSNWGVGDSLMAFGGLRYPESGFVAQLSYLEGECWSVEAECPACVRTILAELRDRGIFAMKLNSKGIKQPESVKGAIVDRLDYPKMIEKGKAILARDEGDWVPIDTGNVLAGLADELDEKLLATRILDLGAVIICPYCEHTFELSNGLQSM